MFYRGLHIPASGQIDWSNPITKGLTALFVCSGAGARDLVTGRFHTATGGSHAVGALGPAWQSAGTGSYIECGLYSNTLPYSVIIACNVVQGVDAISPVGLTDLAGNAGWSLRTVQWQNVTELGLTHLNGGGDNLANPNLSMVGWYGQDEHVLSVAVDGQNVRYARGKAARSTGLTAGFTGGTHTFSIGKEGTSGDTNRSAVPSGSLFYWVAYYNRQLSFTELDFWHNNAGAIAAPRRVPSVALRSRRYEAIQPPHARDFSAFIPIYHRLHHPR